MPKVAISGASGFVGRHLLAAMANTDWSAVPLVRQPAGLEGEQVIGALELAENPGLSRIDAFVHLAAMTSMGSESGEADVARAFRRDNVDATRSALEIARSSGAQRFVYLSSAKVVGEASTPGAPFAESSPCAPQGPYAETKLEGEALVASYCEKHSISWTILRPPLVYGRGVKGNFQALAKLAASGLPLPLGYRGNGRSLCHVGNLVDFIVFALGHDSTRNRCFMVADQQPVSTGEMLTAMAGAMGKNARLIAVPPGLFRPFLKLAGKAEIYERLFGNLEVDTSAAMAAGWTPLHSFEAGLRETFSEA